ncbi:DUF2332 domain-containing protein [Solibacillus sp. FSL R7-0682]|uniref:DUF2332 domain-containing protein n=1 Tax=Solibacillus sp. FSL R7-0682 TaxID=2921690 RepID=UPI0030F96C4C
MEHLIEIFNRFKEREAAGNSPLYVYWCGKIVEDQAILNLISHIPKEQPKPNLFFASVQFVAAQKNHPLYSYIQHPKLSIYELEQSFQQLTNLCQLYEVELIHCFQTKYVQTNEINRATYLYPIFSEIAKMTKLPLSLIEIGTSAGLLLNLDHFYYAILEKNSVIEFGNPNSDLQLTAQNLGEPLKSVFPFSVQNRIGYDLNIIDLTKEEDYLWLNALIWPEQIERKERLKQVRKLNQSITKQLLEEDFLTSLPNITAKLDETTQIVIFHTHVANQFPEKLKKNFLQLLNQLSNTRAIYHVYNNLFDGHLHVDFIQNGHTSSLKVIQHYDGHGKYFDWNEQTE